MNITVYALPTFRAYRYSSYGSGVPIACWLHSLPTGKDAPLGTLLAPYLYLFINSSTEPRWWSYIGERINLYCSRRWPILLQMPTYIGRNAEQYRSSSWLIELPIPSNIYSLYLPYRQPIVIPQDHLHYYIRSHPEPPPSIGEAKVRITSPAGKVGYINRASGR